jgi:hypothetical protein
MVNDFIIVTIGILLCTSIFVCLELLHRRKKYSPETLRRIAHIASSIIASVFSIFLSPPFFLTAIIFFFLLIITSRRKKIFNHIHNVSRPTVGEELLPIGFLISYLIASGNSTLFIPAFLILGIADPLAGIVIKKNKNNLLATIVFFIISIIILSFFPFSFLSILFVSLIAALVERLSGYGTDNLTVPVTVVLLLQIIT